ncbi:MAG: hypothetical protein WBC75_06510 [Dehalococcoidales bacterium]
MFIKAERFTKEPLLKKGEEEKTGHASFPDIHYKFTWLLLLARIGFIVLAMG